MVTIKDIAKRLGVTPATVSLALNGKGRVSSVKRAEIRAVAEEMHYVPSNVAQTMRTKQSKTIGVLVGTIHNEFFVDEISAISDVLSERGYSLFICDAHRNVEIAAKSISALRSRGVDGIITTFGFDANEAMISEIKTCVTNGIKVFTLTTGIDLPEVPLVNFSFRDQFVEVLSNLVENGHRNIGCLTVQKGEWLDTNRFELFQKEMKSLNVFKEEYVYRIDIFKDDAKEVVRHLLLDHPEITAIIGINDYVAIHAMKGILGMGLKIPEDISLVGFDGIEGTQMVTPSITTIKTPHELGTIIAEKLLDSIEDPNYICPHKFTVPCSIIWGDSIGKAK